MGGLQRQFAAIPEAVIFPFNIPTLSGFGSAAGLQFPAAGPQRLAHHRRSSARQSQKFIAAARQRPELGALFTSFDPNYPQIKVELDREKARTLGVPVNDVFQALSADPGRRVRQRLQPLRAALPRLRAGRARRHGSRRRTSARSTFARRPPTRWFRCPRWSPSGSRGQRIDDPLQPAALGRNPGRAGAGLHLRTGARGAGAGVRGDDAQGDGLRLRVDVVPGEGGASLPAPTFILAIVCVFLLLAALYESWRLPWAVLWGRRWSRWARSSASG